MAESITLRPDGPHSPEYTKEVADSLAEAVRVLNYATKGGAGLQFPSDAAEVLGALEEAMQRCPQLLRQLSEWLGREHAAGRVGEWSEGRNQDDDTAVLAVQVSLESAIESATELAGRLETAFSAASALEGRP